MILTVRRLELVNWLTHRQETVEFPDTGVFLLWGNSGAGKSSLLEGIAFALAGVTATRAQRIDELKHELYPDEDLQVRLTLGLGDERQVQIFRGTERGRSVVWMVDHDGTLLEGNAAVKERIGGLLGGMDGPTLFATYYSQQGELDALVKMAGGGRRQFVQRMLGVGVLDGVVRDVRKTVSNAQERIGLIDDSLPPESVDELRSRQAGLRQEERVIEELRDGLSVELEAVETVGKGLRERLERTKTDWERWQSLTPQLAVWRDQELPARVAEESRARRRVADLEAAAERLESRPDRDRLERLRREAEGLAAAEGALQALSDKEAEVVRAETALREAVSELATVSARTPSDDHEDPDALSALRAELRSEYRLVSQSLAELPDADGLGDECYACLRAFDERSRAHVHESVERRADELRARLSQLTEAGGSLESRIASAETARSARIEHAADTARLEQTVEHRRSLLDVATVALETAKGSADLADGRRLAALRSELVDASEALASIAGDERLAAELPSARAELVEASARVADVSGRIETASAELEALSVDPVARASAESEYERTRTRYLELTRQRGETLAEQQRVHGELGNVEIGIARHEQLSNDRKEATDRAIVHRRIETSVKEFRQYLIGTIRPMLEDLTSAHLSELTEGSMPAVSINEEYDMAIKRHGEFRRIGLCSGGEQARAAFSLRLALTQLVSQRTDTPVGFMVFDEIFGSQDEEHRKAILDSLVHLRSIYPQVFLISHEEMLKDSPLISMILSVPDAESTNRITVENR